MNSRDTPDKGYSKQFDVVVMTHTLIHGGVIDDWTASELGALDSPANDEIPATCPSSVEDLRDRLLGWNLAVLNSS